MIHIKKILVGNNETLDFNAIIDTSNKTIKLENDSSKSQILGIIYNSYNQSLKMLDVNNREILIYSLHYINDTKKYSMYKFDFLIIGTFNRLPIQNINKVYISFQLLNTSKLFINNDKNINFEINNTKIIISNQYIEMFSQGLSEENIVEIIQNIFEIIAIIYGSFPKINYFEFLTTNNERIKKYFKAEGYISSSNDNVIFNQKLIDFSYIENFSEVYSLYIDMKKKLNKTPIQGFFISQSSTQYYIDYKLVLLLQSLEGFCSKYYSKTIKERKAKENKIILDNIINPIEDFINENQKRMNCSDDLKGKLLSSLKYPIKKIDFRVYLEYIFETDFAKSIFSTEISLEKSSTIILSKNDFISISVNERNRLSHMNTHKKNVYFTKEQYRPAYEKYKLIFRCLILKELNLKVTDDTLKNMTNHIERSTFYN